MRRVGALLMAGGLALLVGWVPGSPASAAGAPVSAWWQESNQAPTPVPVSTPANPSTPPDGIQVTTTAAGVVAIGAVRFSPPEAGADAVMTLRMASGTATSASSDLVVHVCPVTNSWMPVQNGPWSARATYDETSCITGSPSPNGTSVSFAIPATAQRGGLVDVAIEALSSAPVSLAFAHPVASDLALAAPAAAPPVGPPPAPADTVAPAPVQSSSPVVVPVAAPDAAPSNGPGLAAPVAIAQPAVPKAPSRTVLLVPRTFFAPAATTSPLNDNRTTRILAVAGLLGIGMALFWFGGQPARAPRMIGTLGGRMGSAAAVAGPAHDVRGIGRFARIREPGGRPGR